ncbi:MAG: tRNA (adenosine(37)-N6)-dimethylallyltransferase MiaA [Candidatus Moraniibacteriota bacterium]|nr:MAG: tRNA (adenosine(37)-N6)-dimethylallyltransferase MiaA [Candidatus Moranbacteria bacterium]
MRTSIIVIGPTASGKSDLAIAIAQKQCGEVISADSRQIYRWMDIGSGKEPGTLVPNPAQNSIAKKTYLCEGVPHYMIDIVHPNMPYSAGKFVKKAAKIRDDIWARGKCPIVCGGTFFWAQALAENRHFPAVVPNAPLRKKLARKSPEELYALLQKRDPIRAASIDPHNPVRLIRAIEIAHALGAVPPPPKNTPISPDTRILAITHPREKLYTRIEKRLTQRLNDGMLDEVYRLHHDHSVPWTRLVSFGLEYKWCTHYLRGHITYDDMYANLLRDIRRYAKRQETWIRAWSKTHPIIRVTTQKDGLRHAKIRDK